MKVLAIIPARGGSKTLPNKNILPFAGKPLIAHTILTAQECPEINRIAVSSDSEEIIKVAQRYDAETPFLRPPELSDDQASGTDVCIHCLNFYQAELAYEPDLVVFLQPTSPLRMSLDISNAIHLLEEKQAEAVISVSQSEAHPLWMKKLDSHGRIQPFFPDATPPNTRQELEPAYLLNGAIYLSRVDHLLKNRSFYSESTVAYIMPSVKSVDIDTREDFEKAEKLFLSSSIEQ